MSLADLMARNNSKPRLHCLMCGKEIVFSADGYCGDCQATRLKVDQDKAWAEGEYYIFIPEKTSLPDAIVLRKKGRPKAVAVFQLHISGGEKVGETADGWNINADVWELKKGHLPAPLTKSYVLNHS